MHQYIEMVPLFHAQLKWCSFRFRNESDVIQYNGRNRKLHFHLDGSKKFPYTTAVLCADLFVVSQTITRKTERCHDASFAISGQRMV